MSGVWKQYIFEDRGQGETSTFGLTQDEIPAYLAYAKRSGFKVKLGARTLTYSQAAMNGVDMAKPYTPYDMSKVDESFRFKTVVPDNPVPTYDLPVEEVVDDSEYDDSGDYEE